MLHIYSDTCMNGRSTNQDRYTSIRMSLKEGTSAQLLAVADGMGGLECGELYAEAALSALASYTAQTVSHAEQSSIQNPRESLTELLCRSFESMAEDICGHINRSVLGEVEKKGIGAGGATLSACVVIDKTLFAFNTGDSPIYLISGGKASELSVRDNIAERYVREGRLERGSKEYYEKSCSLTSYIGKRNGEVITHFCKRQLSEHDIVILGSDGAFGNINCTEDLERMLSAAPVNSICGRIFTESSRFTDDNQTAIVIEYFEKASKGLFSFFK